ncbi:MAG: hypothetical protein RL577_1658 [Bacteroidota bacterium]
MIKRAGLCLVLFPKLFAQIASSPFALGACLSPLDTEIPAIESYLAAGPADLYRLALNASSTHFSASAWQEGNLDVPMQHLDLGTRLSLNRHWQVEAKLGLDRVQSLGKALPNYSLALAYESTYWLRVNAQPFASLSYPLSNARFSPSNRSHSLWAGYRYSLPSEYGASLDFQLGLYAEEATWALGWQQDWRHSDWRSLLAFESGPYPLRVVMEYRHWKAALRYHGQLRPSLALGWRKSLQD